MVLGPLSPELDPGLGKVFPIAWPPRVYLVMLARRKEKMEVLGEELAQMELSHYFARRIAQERGRGGLLLVSSMAWFHGASYFANYSGTKAYIFNLDEAINREPRGSGEHVSVLVPGSTKIPVVDTVEANMDIIPMPYMSVEKVVDSGLRAPIKNKPHQVPGLMFKMMTGMVGRRQLPRGANVRMWGAMMKKTMLPDRI